MLLITKGCRESILTSRNKAITCCIMLPVGHLKKPQKRAQPFAHFLAKCSFPGHHVCSRANTVIIVLKYWKTSLDTGDKQIC